MANEAPKLGYVYKLNADHSVDDGLGSITAIAGTGEILEGTVAAQLPSVSCKLVRFRAFTTNGSDVYIGKSTVAIEGTVTNATTGWKLEPGDDTGWIPATNTNLFYTVGEGTTTLLNYMALA